VNLNFGKVVFKTQEEAQKVAQRMSQNRDEPFTTYKIPNSGWAVGGVFLKKKHTLKVKSIKDIRHLWEEFKEDEFDTSVDEYTTEVEAKELSGEISTAYGDDSVWILVSHYIKSGTELGMRTTGSYLVLEITNGIETVYPKLGGAFGRHIPLMSKVANSLMEKPVIWSSWNSKSTPDKWDNNSWFYKLELNDTFRDEE
jgi:hypothetical protein